MGEFRWKGGCMIPKSLIERMFGAATIQRWNDHVRPVELTELDKQAHKAFIVYLLARFEEDRGASLDWSFLVEGFLFEFLPRVVLTDIKAPFYHRLMAVNGPKVNEHVMRVLQEELAEVEGGLPDRFRRYLEGREGEKLERRLLKAAHYLATQWEFRLVYHLEPFLYGIERTKAEIENQIEDYIDLIGVQKIHLKQKAYGFVDLCGQLRFQQRWAQTPRMPRTSVLGHSLFVALLAHLFGLKRRFCPIRVRNNFFCALMHDLPELFTRDIISPIKRSIEGLETFVEQEERRLVEERLLPLLPDAWHVQVMYYLDRPFENRILEGGQRRGLRVIDAQHNDDRYEPTDGELIKHCDNLSALIEASKSLETGIQSPALLDGAATILAQYRAAPEGPIPYSVFMQFCPAALAGEANAKTSLARKRSRGQAPSAR